MKSLKLGEPVKTYIPNVGLDNKLTMTFVDDD